jgi:hypothetical protein
MVQTQGIPAQAVGWEKVVYASSMKRAVMWSKYHQLGSEMNEAMVAYNFETNAWEVLDIGGNFLTEGLPEGGHSVGAFDYNPNNGTLIYRCCHAGSNQVENPFHTWWFDLAGQAGLDKHTSPKPPDTALQPSAAFDPAHNVFVYHGGDSFVGTWLYNPATNAWTKVPSGGVGAPDPSFVLHSMAYSSAAQKVYLFGGLAAQYSNDLYAFDAGSNTWTAITPGGPAKPSPRIRAAFAYDSVNNVFLLYGGKNDTGDLGDTWVYDPAQNTWTQINPPVSPPIAAGGPFERLTYDPDHNVFILVARGPNGYAEGDWALYGIQTWLFRYNGIGPNAGTLTTAAQANSGGLNRYAYGWGKQPWLASSGTSLFAAWSELGNPFVPSGPAWPHIYVSQYAGSWTQLGSSFSDVSTASNEAHEPSIAVVGGTLWASWYEANNSSTSAALIVKSWDGSQWNGAPVTTQAASGYPGRSHIVDIGGVPYIAYLEVDKGVAPQRANVWVKSWTGSAWTVVGATPLNRNSTGTTAGSLSIATDGSRPFTAWTEYVHDYTTANDTNPQVYAAMWDGTTWVPLGGSLNVDPLGGWAYEASIAVLAGTPYVAWTERTQSGNSKLYVKRWDGSSWTLVGAGALNQNAGGWVFRPSLAADSIGNRLFVGWVEQAAIGAKPQGYVAQSTASGWTILGGGALNMNTNGSAQRISLTVFQGNVVAAWGEVAPGSFRQIFVKQWNGTAWTLLPAPAPDGTKPVVGISSPVQGSTISGTVTITVQASDNVGVASLTTTIDGSIVASQQLSSGYSVAWDTTTVPNGIHSIVAWATDAAGNSAKTSVSLTVSNSTLPPVISRVSVVNATSSAATIVWTTDRVSTSQVAYGLTTAYGSMSSSDPTLVTAHDITLTGLSPSTTYNYQALSRDAQGNLAASANYTFTTAPAGDTVVTALRIAGTPAELTALTNGAVVTPSTAPAGFSGTLVVNAPGSVNFAPTPGGTGVYFLACCTNVNNAYYKFPGSAVGSIFKAKQGQISFSLQSRYSFADRQSLASAARYVFDVSDGNGHQFSFLTQVISGRIVFTYRVGGSSQYYYVPSGTEDALFGKGVTLNVTLSWGNGLLNLSLNNSLAVSTSYTPGTMNWSSASVFDLGAYEYYNAGGYSVSDDIISGFVVSAPATAYDTTPPTVSLISPSPGSTISGAVNVTANATDNMVLTGVQFLLDGNPIVSIAAPPYAFTWDTTAVTNGSHTLSAVATDGGDNTATATATVTVSNLVVPPAISAVTVSSVSAYSATITWTTDRASTSQVAFGPTTSYGSLSTLRPALVTAHSVTLTGLSPSTTYNFQTLSRDALGNVGTSANFIVTTTAAGGGQQTALQIGGDSSELGGTANGSIVAPNVAPPNFTGKVVVNGGGSVNFAPAKTGNGVYFLNCCGNTNNAYYQFTGSGVGSVFTPIQGQISFTLKSRYSFAERQYSYPGLRYAFDVRDANGHQFYFLTQVSSGYLVFTYLIGGTAGYYYVPRGNEDALFGKGVPLDVAISWGGGNLNLRLNNSLVSSVAYAPRSMSWTAASVFDLGALEYSGAGGYSVSDDIIDEFTVSAPASAFDTTPPTVSFTAPSAGSTVSGTLPVSATASDNIAVASVQFLLDGNALGQPIPVPPYSLSWDTTTTTNGSHTLSAVATDAAGLKSTATLSTTVANAVIPPVISAVTVSAFGSSYATITWSTDKASDSQVAYGLTTAYGSLSALKSALVTAHSVTLNGLSASTTYNFQVLSRDAQGNLTTSANYSLTTSAPTSGPQTLLQISGESFELASAANGAAVTPNIAPPGFAGTLVVNGSGSVNFAPAVTGNGVFFLNCCGNTNNAYYKFTGSALGTIFSATQGQISFTLKSRYSFAQRQSSAASPRYAFDASDANGHRFYFLTQVTSGYLVFTYLVGGSAQYYYVPQGSEDVLFGNGVPLKITLSWGNGSMSLALNNSVVKTTPYTTPTLNWTAASVFDLGALEYSGAGGYSVSDDIIDEFTVSGPGS